MVEETGRVASVSRGRDSARIGIEGDIIFSDLKPGDSVCTNGVCLTATEISGKIFTADVSAETLRRSTLGKLKLGDTVNLERAMPADGRFGGHIVSGHIDGTGHIISMRREDNSVMVTVSADDKLMRYIVEKGSAAVDGISLTVAELFADAFSAAVIPHTFKNTSLGKKKIGDEVNLECDIIGKYVERLLGKPNGITEEFLKEYGF